jgi:hypothetical protein
MYEDYGRSALEEYLDTYPKGTWQPFWDTSWHLKSIKKGDTLHKDIFRSRGTRKQIGPTDYLIHVLPVLFFSGT